MNTLRERVLLVEHDPEVCDLISRQTLQPLGYRVAVVGAASQAIQEAVKFAPDVILVNLSLPDFKWERLVGSLFFAGTGSSYNRHDRKRDGE